MNGITLKPGGEEPSPTLAMPAPGTGMKLQDQPRSEWPRERLVAKGADALSHAELVAILLRTGLKGMNVVEVARQVIQKYGSLQALATASVDENLQFVRYLVDPRKAEAQRQTFTLAVEGDSRIRRMELRNGVIVISDSAAAAPTHVKLTRQELAAFVLGTRAASETDPLSQLDRVLDRSHLMPPGAVESVLQGMRGINLP